MLEARARCGYFARTVSLVVLPAASRILSLNLSFESGRNPLPASSAPSANLP